MPVNNALTPEGQNALGAAFGYYPQLRRNRTVQDPRLAAEMPLQFLRGRLAGTLGLPSDVANLVRSPMPMEMYGDVDYGPQTQVPYGSQELLRTLPLPPQGPAQSAAANVGAVIPLTPMEALQAARAARQAALAGGRAAMTAGKAGERYAERVVPGIMERGGLGAEMLQGMSRGTVSPLDVYHGTPYTLPPTARNPLGEFDASKIGTGEGAQAYGFGIYTAENPAVAKGYQESLAFKGFSLKPETERLGINLPISARGEFMRQAQAKLPPEKLARNLQNANIDSRSLPIEKLTELFKTYQEKIGGNLYKVDLPDAMIPKMLDYDKQMSEQSLAVQKILLPYQKEIGGSFGTGEQTLKAIAFERRMKGLDDSPAAVAEQLRQMGIPGIKYLDEASRAKGEGTRNFVTFPGEEKNLRILERNGQSVNALAKNK
jgi:hypothetical protein